MKFVILACIAAVAFAAPQYSSSEEVEFVPILRDDRVHEEDGTYSLDFEAGNGIRVSQSGSPDGDKDAVIMAGEYSYTAPDGTLIVVKYVADGSTAYY
ncbi:endocuticle structural glycoprotein SgAbd-8-like [Penaeus chinensis]|uniref:endocuticle structural glycoprotein SgAbd-8-like n=1 Tax=Penaeus chinensis TaxID=139456 RepID=UPI001FB82265|nr:endocuticle structural glycoprotein SgAbd-8-like [Penaeus chinensis]